MILITWSEFTPKAYSSLKPQANNCLIHALPEPLHNQRWRSITAKWKTYGSVVGSLFYCLQAHTCKPMYCCGIRGLWKL